MASDRPEQDLASVAKNKTFFAENDKYAGRVASLTTYRNIRVAVNRAIDGKQRLLDVGNGGVFDYDTDLVGEVVGVDLFLDQAPPWAIPSNVTLRKGNALALSEANASYDAVLSAFVFHHLVSSDPAGTIGNVRCAIAEARRVLEPGGQFIVAESCVSPRAYAIEKRLFTPLRLIASTPLMSHPATLQFPYELIRSMLGEHFERVVVEPIPVGRIILQFGHRWPTALTPARPYLFTAE